MMLAKKNFVIHIYRHENNLPEKRTLGVTLFIPHLSKALFIRYGVTDFIAASKSLSSELHDGLFEVFT